MCVSSKCFNISMVGYHCHVINVRNYATMLTLYDINGCVIIQYIFRYPISFVKTGYVSALSRSALNRCKIKVKVELYNIFITSIITTTRMMRKTSIADDR